MKRILEWTKEGQFRLWRSPPDYIIRDVVANPVQKIYAVFSKMYMDEKYSVAEKMDKSFRGTKILFSEEIEKLLERENQEMESD